VGQILNDTRSLISADKVGTEYITSHNPNTRSAAMLRVQLDIKRQRKNFAVNQHTSFIHALAPVTTGIQHCDMNILQRFDYPASDAHPRSCEAANVNG
jgi:hypothetical protein